MRFCLKIVPLLGGSACGLTIDLVPFSDLDVQVAAPHEIHDVPVRQGGDSRSWVPAERVEEDLARAIDT